MQHKRVARFHHLCSRKSRPWASHGLDFAMPSVLDHFGLCGEGEGRGGERGNVRLQRMLCQNAARCTDERTLVSKARGPEDAKQKNGGVPSSVPTQVKAVGFLCLGLCNALCARPLWVVWGRGTERGREGQGQTSKTALSEHSLLSR